MTTNMASCTFKTWRWREYIITWTIACFTLCWHTICDNNKTMTFIFNSFTAMAILFLKWKPCFCLFQLEKKKKFTCEWIIECDMVLVELFNIAWPSLSYNTWKIFGIIFGSTRSTSPRNYKSVLMEKNTIGYELFYLV